MLFVCDEFFIDSFPFIAIELVELGSFPHSLAHSLAHSLTRPHARTQALGRHLAILIENGALDL